MTCLQYWRFFFFRAIHFIVISSDHIQPVSVYGPRDQIGILYLRHIRRLHTARLPIYLYYFFCIMEQGTFCRSFAALYNFAPPLLPTEIYAPAHDPSSSVTCNEPWLSKQDVQGSVGKKGTGKKGTGKNGNRKKKAQGKNGTGKKGTKCMIGKNGTIFFQLFQ